MSRVSRHESWYSRTTFLSVCICLDCSVPITLTLIVSFSPLYLLDGVLILFVYLTAGKILAKSLLISSMSAGASTHSSQAASLHLCRLLFCYFSMQDVRVQQMLIVAALHCSCSSLELQCYNSSFSASGAASGGATGAELKVTWNVVMVSGGKSYCSKPSVESNTYSS